MHSPGKTVSEPKATTKLAAVEVEALLHETGSGPVEAGAATIEMLPLVALNDEPEPSRIARGSDPIEPPVARGTEPSAPSRARRTVERLSIADILKRK